MNSFRNIFHTINRAFNREVAPSKVAKDRLKLIITQDRFDVGHDTMHALQQELIAVLSNHFDFTEDTINVSLKQRGDSYVLVADFPHSDAKKGN